MISMEDYGIQTLARFCVFTLISLFLYSLFDFFQSTDECIKNKQQSIDTEDNSGARRSRVASGPVSRIFSEVNSVYDAFLHGLKISKDSPCLGWRLPSNGEYAWITYNEVHGRAYSVGCGLVCLGCQPSQATHLGILAPNSVEWFLTDLGCQMFSMITVPIYDSHGYAACTHIIKQAGLQSIVCHSSKVSFLLSALNQYDVGIIRSLVTVGVPISSSDRSAAARLRIKVISFEDLEKLGETNPIQKKPPKSDDLYTVCYTSGTTGTPKGAMLTHDNVISDLSAFLYVLKQHGRSFGVDDVHLSFLPLSHMYERVNQIVIFMNGGKIGFFNGDIKKLLDDFKTLRPTVFGAVPRLLNRIHDKVTNEINKSWIKRWIFQIALNAKKRDLARKIVRRDTIWDYLIFNKIQALLGGRVWFIISGSAPLSPKVATFIRCVMGCQVQEGYGQTETVASVTLQLLDDFTAGHVGPPTPVNVVKLVDVPEMDYWAKNKQGEICVKGRNVFKGYLHNPAMTAEVLDKDRWLYTGDIGEWTTVCCQGWVTEEGIMLFKRTVPLRSLTVKRTSLSFLRESILRHRRSKIFT
ncbi:long-chain-fatty-acid--CoA ligase 6 isoform X2 [Nematostella vectensis]|uniref:long-chain-fatty-acid--CoA ligase 6 isoform X2 n=1 Tax=Nematostella vectensis TaxID=45351 RepID=UPI0020771E4F|nr:long-chain-fatty-acid--CoA ligase 6 isoform X2 [Nematostella vectensis]XP_048590129.1 long-chain-fatty-acid--CoA ligase 6 isoform X2 [Nematostella vectensis]